jgi:hypothetical protein
MTVACRAPRTHPDKPCATFAATLRPRGSAKPVALGPDKRISTVLNGAMRNVNRVRLQSRPGLRSRSVATRARTFQRLNRANADAVRALTKLRLRPQEPALFDNLVKALRSEAAILRRLARSAARRRRGTYNGARDALRMAERDVRAAVRDLRAAGYTDG